LAEAIPYVHLAELELTNSVRRLCVAGVLDRSDLPASPAQLERDVRDSLLERRPLNQAPLYKTALELSERRLDLSLRALDILHVSAVLLLGSTAFATFDPRQRGPAQAEGLSLPPARICPA